MEILIKFSKLLKITSIDMLIDENSSRRKAGVATTAALVAKSSTNGRYSHVSACVLEGSFRTMLACNSILIFALFLPLQFAQNTTLI